ncbi:D-alanyl-D-alanine carboxypeptidase/D-alanyl-D-alanine-endopeptidase [Sphingobacteriales bacterium UPWRP_1]|nr:D-alanyl-D-alanine carboxypeptidase/D-alanyl-D-alanine-endopeptidase [Sphingobacteriales bacterium TSM_CSS]PSJ77521.1 D-alanyl-D-alanine carboxypeptidase/D-alanyl-D-alanine-endopeptidase [Sphingobacteriales bacterium UPWRP_1]
MRVKYLAIIGFYALLQPCFIAPLAVLAQPKPLQYQAVLNAITRFDNDPDLQTATWGYYVKDVKSGEVIATYNAHKTLSPASTLKVVTTAAALSVLGGNYTFTTKLEYDGIIDAKGVLKGNLYITGGGDPTLATNRSDMATAYERILEQWVAAVQKKGIKNIEGQVIGDASFFPDDMLPRQWVWEDIGNYYGAGVSGLNFHENRYDLIFSSGKTGTAAKLIKLIPEVPNLQLINEVTAGAAGTGDEAFLYGAPYNPVFYIRGTIPPNQSSFIVRGAAPEPALFAAFSLQNALKNAGITISSQPVTVRQLQLAGNIPASQRFTLLNTQSPPLSKIVYWTNKRSVNLFAETILRAMGKQQYGQGTIENGIKAIKQYWQSRGIDLTGLIIHDGSGLSPANSITARQLADMLASYAANANFDEFYQSLPQAGMANDDGFLKSFLNGTAAAGKIRAKSGYIKNCRAFTGYALTKSKQLVAFAVLVNRYTCTNSQMNNKIEQLLLPLVQLD